MNETDVTTEGLRYVSPGRKATVGANTGPGGSEQPPTARRRGRQRAEQPMVPDVELRSYYGRPVINEPVWEAPDIPGYLFLGGLAGAGSVVAAAAQLTGRRQLTRTLKVGSTAAAGLSLVALVHDLGRRDRFLNMLRVFKPTSPMSVGSWILAAYGPAATVAAASEVTGVLPGIGSLATAGAAALGPALATYTAALIANTAVPAWHDAHRQLPFVFAASAVTSAAGLGLLGAPVRECGPVRALAVAGGVAELATVRTMQRRMGISAEVFEQGQAKRYHRLATALIAAGTAGTAAGWRSRVAAAGAGACLLAGSALTRFAIFEGGIASAKDPKYTVEPQRARLQARHDRPTPAAGTPDPGALPADGVDTAGG